MITKNQGLTLIELMIVVAIVGIIGAFAFPSYQNQVRRSNRTDAYTALTQMANQQEKWYLANNTYTTDPEDLGRTKEIDETFLTDEGYYLLTIDNADATDFKLTAAAAPGSTQTGDKQGDTACKDLTLDSTGQKTPPECW